MPFGPSLSFWSSGSGATFGGLWTRKSAVGFNLRTQIRPRSISLSSCTRVQLQRFNTSIRTSCRWSMWLLSLDQASHFYSLSLSSVSWTNMSLIDSAGPTRIKSRLSLTPELLKMSIGSSTLHHSSTFWCVHGCIQISRSFKTQWMSGRTDNFSQIQTIQSVRFSSKILQAKYLRYWLSLNWSLYFWAGWALIAAGIAKESTAKARRRTIINRWLRTSSTSTRWVSKIYSTSCMRKGSWSESMAFSAWGSMILIKSTTNEERWKRCMSQKVRTKCMRQTSSCSMEPLTTTFC